MNIGNWTNQNKEFDEIKWNNYTNYHQCIATANCSGSLNDQNAKTKTNKKYTRLQNEYRILNKSN